MLLFDLIFCLLDIQIKPKKIETQRIKAKLKQITFELYLLYQKVFLCNTLHFVTEFLLYFIYSVFVLVSVCQKLYFIRFLFSSSSRALFILLSILLVGCFCYCVSFSSSLFSFVLMSGSFVPNSYCLPVT